jgi:hypothetical protein
VLFENTNNFGFTPVTLHYRITEEAKKNGYIFLKSTSVKWASGATASIPSLRADLRLGHQQKFTFLRPDNVPGRHIDMNFALELQKLELMRKQTQAMQDTAKAQQEQVKVLQEYYNRVQLQQSGFTQPRNCTSTLRGNIIYTDCY